MAVAAVCAALRIICVRQGVACVANCLDDGSIREQRVVGARDRDNDMRLCRDAERGKKKAGRTCRWRGGGREGGLDGSPAYHGAVHQKSQG